MLAGCGGDGGNDAAGGGDDPGRAIFATVSEPTCASCHALADAGATGTVGPDLDELQPSRVRVERAVREGPGGMPSFSDDLTDEQIRQVAEYVEQASRS